MGIYITNNIWEKLGGYYEHLCFARDFIASLFDFGCTSNIKKAGKNMENEKNTMVWESFGS